MVEKRQKFFYVTKTGKEFDDRREAEENEAVEELAKIISGVGYFYLQDRVEAYDLVSLRPSDTPEYMTGEWLGCIHFALGDPDRLKAFRNDTGNKWKPGRTGLEKMIDKACGADEAFVKAFIMWANENVWGPMYGEDK